VRGSFTAQRPEDEDTGYRLQGRAERFGRLELDYARGPWRLTGGVTASGDRYDSANESPSTRLPGYALLDAVVRYRIDRRTVLEFSGSNLADKRYEHAVGYDAPGRTVLFSIRFEGR
jgi:outer membrane cobalamin receptor